MASSVDEDLSEYPSPFLAAAAAAAVVDSSLSKCAVCQDAASGVHYGVPACEGCKGFFRRIVSSRNLGGSCGHSVPIEMTPQSRNTCQWCRLKKCCAVNMGRDRSRLGRRAKVRDSTSTADCSTAVEPTDHLLSAAAFSEIPLPGNDSPSAATVITLSTAYITDCQLMQYIEEKRREFEFQIGRRCGSSSGATKDSSSGLKRSPQPPLPLPPPLKHQRDGPADDVVHPVEQFQVYQQQQPQQSGRSPKKLWLEKCLLLPNSPAEESVQVPHLCRRLVGSLLCHTLEGFVQQTALDDRVTRLLLTGIDRFNSHWPPNASVSGSVVQLVADNINLVLIGHRRTFHFSPERMAQFRAEKLHLTREPLPDEESVVLSRLLAYLPSLLSRVVAFARGIFSDTECAISSAATSEATSNSAVICTADRKRLLLSHCSQLVAMRFCSALVKQQEGYIIDPTLNFRLTRRFLELAKHPMLSTLFNRFFDVSAVWDSLAINDSELAFLSAFCLTSPYIGTQCSETEFANLNSVISVHLSIVGLFWTNLCNQEAQRHDWSASLLQQSHELRLSVRLAAIKRLFRLTSLFNYLLDINSISGNTFAGLESLVNRIYSPDVNNPSESEIASDILLPNELTSSSQFRELSQQQQHWW